MWFKIKTTRSTIEPSGKEKVYKEYWLTDKDNFAEAGIAVMKYIRERFQSLCEIDYIKYERNLKPLANQEGETADKVFVVKIVQDCVQEDGSLKEMKYSVPVYANDTKELYEKMNNYMAQGLEDMRICTQSETKWKIIS